MAAAHERIDKLFVMAKSLDYDSELLSHWARYLTVLVSGYLQRSIRLIYQEYATDKANPNIIRYVGKQLEAFKNPTRKRIVELSYAFNKDWGLEMDTFTQGKAGEAVNSIVAIRNEIAHGGDSQVTIGRIQQYYEEAQKVIDIIETHCNGGA